MAWDPVQYEKFKREREQPFEDALALVDKRAGLRAIDLGCGTGELTRRLADALPSSDVLGMDSSKEMLDKAQKHARAGLRFELRKIEDLDGEWDLIFSHAALHWIDDHEHLISKLVGHLTANGQLVVQMPSNHTHGSRADIDAAAATEPFASALGGWRREVPVRSID